MSIIRRVTSFLSISSAITGSIAGAALLRRLVKGYTVIFALLLVSLGFGISFLLMFFYAVHLYLTSIGIPPHSAALVVAAVILALTCMLLLITIRKTRRVNNVTSMSTAKGHTAQGGLRYIARCFWDGYSNPRTKIECKKK